MTENSALQDSRFVVRKLMSYIRDNNLAGGDKLPPIPQLAELWDVGRNVVRDGLLQAQNLGFVKIHPRLGTFAQRPDLSPLVDALAETMDLMLMLEDENLVHLLDARCVVEVELAAKAAEKRRTEDMFLLKQCLEAMASSKNNRSAYIDADERFHLGIAHLAGNTVLQAFLRALLTLLRPYRLNLLISEENRTDADREHEEIYNRILGGDEEEAKSYVQEHLTPGRRKLLEHLLFVRTTGNTQK